MDVFIHKQKKPFTAQELNELKSSLKAMWATIIKRAYQIDRILSKAGDLPVKNTPDNDVIQDEAIKDFHSQYILPRELIALYFERTGQLRKPGSGLDKKSIIAVGWGNLLARGNKRIDWKILGELYYWFWERLTGYKYYGEWAPP